MIAIGRCLLLFISLAGLTLSDNGRFKAEDIDKFLDYIFRLHNAVRRKHNVKELTRTKNMDIIAEQKLDEIFNRKAEKDALGEVMIEMCYDNTIQLNMAEAIKLFSLPYERGNSYDYESNITSLYEDNFRQIIWQETNQIGLTFRDQKTSYIVLAVYYPRGNIQRTYIDNVHPPINNQPASDPKIGLIYQTAPEKFLDYIFKLHNETRLKHGVPPLERDDALDWAANDVLQHNTEPPEEYGKIYFLGRYDNTILDAKLAKKKFSLWYGQKKYYNCNVEPSPDDTDSTTEFTQIVWKNTQKIGLAIKMRFGRYVGIVLYNPRGNIPKEYASNVIIPRSMDQGESSGNN